MPPTSQGSTLSVRVVSIAEYWDEALPLMFENWHETGFAFPFNPSRERYVRMQSQGLLFAIGAFAPCEVGSIADKLVGYSTAVVVPHPFNPDVKHCSTDALYVTPACRDTLYGGRLLIATEHEAKRRGAQQIAWHTRAGTHLADVLLKRPEYQPADIVVIKEL